MQFIQGDVQDFDALVYGQPHPSTLQFLQNTVQQASSTVTQASQQFFSKVGEAFDYFHGHEAMRRARAAVRKAGNIFVPDDVRYLHDLGSIQNARDTMRRYIMAEPTVRSLFQKQQIEGYEGHYLDTQPGMIADTHNDYQRVMQGMVVEGAVTVVDDVETREPSHYALFYGMESDDELELDIDQQIEVISTWDRVKWFIEQGKDDPTSTWGAML